MVVMAGLLDPLTPDQQELVDLVAETLLNDDGMEWPLFDYVEGIFDERDKDAGTILASFPRAGRWQYGAVWWSNMGQTSKPAPDTEIKLTVLGLHHSNHTKAVVTVFFDVIALMAHKRRARRPVPRQVRELTISDADVSDMLQNRRLLGRARWPGLIYKLFDHEPSFGGGGALPADGHWIKVVPRGVNEYEGVQTIEDYVTRLERITAFEHIPVRPAVPSPLGLVAALDYLDTVWRVVHKTHLFDYPNAERAAKLTYPANTVEEFDSRLSGLGEILRTANAGAKTVAGNTSLPKRTHDDPLAPFEGFLVRSVDPAGVDRVRQAVTDLEHALALRDAAQHAEATTRALRAFEAFAITFPVIDAQQAWMTVTARVVTALDAVREELASTTP